MTDDSMTAFPRVWRKDEDMATSPNAAVLPREDIDKPAPTTKKLASYPSHKFQMVRLLPGCEARCCRPSQG